LIEWRATRLAMVLSWLDFGGPIKRDGKVGSGDVLVWTIRQHVLDLPAPIVATALGYHHHNTTTRLAAEAGITWSNYAPGDHGK
jgi:hypothetical protein